MPATAAATGSRRARATDPGDHRPRLSRELPGRLQVSDHAGDAVRLAGSRQAPPSSRAASLRTAASRSGARRPRAVVGGYRPPRRDDQDVAASLVAVQNVRASLRAPIARRSHGSTSLSAAGKGAAVGQLVMLDVDRGQGLAPDQPTVRTRRPLAGGYVGHGWIGCGRPGPGAGRRSARPRRLGRSRPDRAGGCRNKRTPAAPAAWPAGRTGPRRTGPGRRTPKSWCTADLRQGSGSSLILVGVLAGGTIEHVFELACGAGSA